MTAGSADESAPARRQLPERLRISPDVLFQEIEGEGVLLDTGKETYFSLDPMGTVIWKMLSAEPNLQRLREHMLEAYDVSAEALEQDLEAFVSRLIDAGLVIPES